MITSPLPDVAHLGLDAGCVLLESGSGSQIVQSAIADIGRAYGCDSVEVFSQHAAIIVMLRRGEESCMQMGKVGEHGVNLRRAETVLQSVARAGEGALPADEARRALGEGLLKSGAYPLWLGCLATGLACGAFGCLLGADWISIPPIILGAALGQFTRRTLLHRGQNLFFTVAVVAFIAALIAGLGCRLLGSAHLDIATIAAVLLLVPGPAVLNAQMDAIYGKPNLAAARAFRVAYILLFMTIGLMAAQKLVGL